MSPTDKDPAPMNDGVSTGHGADGLGLSSTRYERVMQRLMGRVQLSVAAHSDYLTVRRGGSAWLGGAPVGGPAVLREDAFFRVELLHLRDGQPLPWPEGVLAQEVLLLQGAWASPSGSDAATDYRYSYRVRRAPGQGPDQPPMPLLAHGDTQAYVRHLRAPVEQLPPLEARWWQRALAPQTQVEPGLSAWIASGPGVQVCLLSGDAQVVSMLVRFEAGAGVNDHHHALDEDCLVLEGEMFLGDMLLQPGDYQLAPAGGGHFGEFSDVGVLFFFHGALDPVLREPRR
ncbi:MAG: cupin domain-containing protein [Curvibacter lanceolatus]|uniref:cupin domain-containing protein n=1 Tax=Curvibacter lanceolatus TaxID=86182 RepID=UPI00039A7291|nr:cupin domain-containing protein [Curvibacter lanceolatus]MBV5293445.1 cupin domain-containing protein [Curvibacter lanceolatus]